MIRVLSPGGHTLVQDHGRAGNEHLGVPTSGAFDPVLYDLANILVGNPPGAAALEATAAGPTLVFDQPTLVSLAGRFGHATINGRPVPAFHTLHVPAGSTLAAGPLVGAVRGYIGFAGGLHTEPVLGSVSTCTLSGLGPAPLATGDVLATGPGGFAPVHRAAPDPTPTGATARVLPGPHAHLFTPDALDALTTTVWRVSPASSRVGVRLDGDRVQAPAQSLPSLGMVTGAVQVPPSGTPIVLGPDHGATGGYPVPFVVASVDLPLLAQATPGAPLRLRPVASAPAASRPRVWDLAALSA